MNNFFWLKFHEKLLQTNSHLWHMGTSRCQYSYSKNDFLPNYSYVQHNTVIVDRMAVCCLIYIYIYYIYTIYIHILYICTLLKKYLKGEMLCLHIGFTTFIFYTISSYHHSKIFMSYYHDSIKRHHNGSPHDRFLGVVSLNITSSCTLHLFNLVFIKRNRFTFTESFLVLVNMNLKSDISRQIFSHWLHVLLLQYYLMTRRNFRCPSNSLQQDVKNEQVMIDSVVLSMEI